MQRHIIL